MECVAVCNDDALRPLRQTEETVQKLREAVGVLELDLPNTPERYSRVDDLEEGVGALETMLLDKGNYLAFSSGDGACLGCSEKTVMHLFTATVEALMQARVSKNMSSTSTSSSRRLQKHIQLKLKLEERQMSAIHSRIM